jgi:hypothetical protein
MDPTVPLEAFNNATIATGGDSRLYNLNVFYNVSLYQFDGWVGCMWYAGLTWRI